MQAGGMGAPPMPAAWMDVQQRGSAGASNGEAPRGGIHEASSAWKHCKNVARDDGRTPDLYDLLSHSVRESQYSFPPQGVRIKINPNHAVNYTIPTAILSAF